MLLLATKGFAKQPQKAHVGARSPPPPRDPQPPPPEAAPPDPSRFCLPSGRVGPGRRGTPGAPLLPVAIFGRLVKDSRCTLFQATDPRAGPPPSLPTAEGGVCMGGGRVWEEAALGANPAVSSQLNRPGLVSGPR